MESGISLKSLKNVNPQIETKLKNYEELNLG